MRVLVCGSRNYANRGWMWARLNMIPRPFTLIHGAARGADSLAGEWAADKPDVTVESYPADWDKHGKAAGPIRNQQMLDSGIDLVIAYPGIGKGTWDMVDRARRAGVSVEVNPHPYGNQSEVFA